MDNAGGCLRHSLGVVLRPTVCGLGNPACEHRERLSRRRDASRGNLEGLHWAHAPAKAFQFMFSLVQSAAPPSRYLCPCTTQSKSAWDPRLIGFHKGLATRSRSPPGPSASSAGLEAPGCNHCVHTLGPGRGAEKTLSGTRSGVHTAPLSAHSF